MYTYLLFVQGRRDPIQFQSPRAELTVAGVFEGAGQTMTGFTAEVHGQTATANTIVPAGTRVVASAKLQGGSDLK